MNRMRMLPLTATGAALLAGTVFVCSAGPLDPPAGPVTSTYKTLTEVEPRIALSQATAPGDADSVLKITQQGSYYLTGNVIGEAGKAGIEIAVSAVTLDLSGFVLAGAPASLDGVVVSALHHSISIRNGSVRDWGGSGIEGTNARNSSVESVRVIACGGAGIRIGGRSIVRSCNSIENTSVGIEQSAGVGGSIIECMVGLNLGDGILARTHGSVQECVSAGNGGNGISLQYGASALRCEAGSNTFSGIAGYNNAITVRECSVSLNGTAGIYLESDSRADGNKIDGNGTGIVVAGSDNHLENNSITDNTLGLDIGMGGNLVVRNSFAGNTTTALIAGDNAVGPMVTALDIAASSNPHANYEY